VTSVATFRRRLLRIHGTILMLVALGSAVATTATFHVCSRCGAVPLVTSQIADHLYAVVNVNVLENIDPSRIHRAAVTFEGEDVESRLERRKRNWIGEVRISERQP